VARAKSFSNLSGSGAKRSEILDSKDPLLAHLNDLTASAGRLARSQFLTEGSLLVQRAIEDSLPVDWIVYTSDLVSNPAGARLLDIAAERRIRCISCSAGLLGKVTTSRPVPDVVAPVTFRFPEASDAYTPSTSTILIAENINNPDNLGMTLRTADAAGAQQVVVSGSDPFHKNCVRAARGAVGRLPITNCRDLARYVSFLKSKGVCVVGAALDGEHDLYDAPITGAVAIIVGNENSGITADVLRECTIRVRIPMAAGQDSLNVGVAAGVILYEVRRRALGGGR
jgi:TrmH family RNA methyltransferase